MAMTFRYEYPKFKVLSENIANKNIQYFTSTYLDPTFNLSLYEYSTEKRLPDITCSLSEVAHLKISNDALYKQIIDYIGLIKYRNNYFAYDTQRKTIVHIKNNYMILTYLFGLTHNTRNYFPSISFSTRNLILYKIEDYKFGTLE